MNRIGKYLEKLDGFERADARRTASAIVTAMTPPLPWTQGTITEERSDEIMMAVVSAIGVNRAEQLVADLLGELAADDAALAD
jgi:hypothetical protein